jgi:6-pyruvoyl-tetrahydropterin synthase
VKFDLEGYHRWPGAPEEYKRLGSEHGHTFHFEIHIPVEHVNRELEFLDVRRTLVQIVRTSYKGEPCDFRGMSCEMIAQSVWRSVENCYGYPPIRIAVYEDVFVGAELLSD